MATSVASRRPASSVTAAKTASGGAAWATSVATRRKAACSPAIRRDSAYSWALSRDTASSQAMSWNRVQPPGRERGADQAVFQQQHRPQRPAAEDGHGQQGAAVNPGEVRVAGKPVVAGGVGHDQGLACPLGVAQHRGRRYGVPDRCG